MRIYIGVSSTCPTSCLCLCVSPSCFYLALYVFLCVNSIVMSYIRNLLLEPLLFAVYQRFCSSSQDIVNAAVYVYYYNYYYYIYY